MPSVTERQHNFFAMSRTAKGRAELAAHGKKPAPVQVANEFVQADKGRKLSTLKPTGQKR